MSINPTQLLNVRLSGKGVELEKQHTHISTFTDTVEVTPVVNGVQLYVGPAKRKDGFVMAGYHILLSHDQAEHIARLLTARVEVDPLGGAA